MTRALLAAVAAGALAVLLGHRVIGVPPGWALALATAPAALAFVVVALPRAREPRWVPLPDDDTDVAGAHQAATLVARLTEAHADPRRFGTRLQPRLARLATARLRAVHGVGLDDPRASALLGPELYRLVTDPGATLPDPRRTAALLGRLEEL